MTTSNTTITQAFITMTAFRSNLSLEANQARNADMLASINILGLKSTPVTGYYKEVQSDKTTSEETFLVQVSNRLQVQDLKLVAEAFQQDCILFVNNNQATLLFPNSNNKHLGEWQEVKNANGLEAYTVINNKMYVAK